MLLRVRCETGSVFAALLLAFTISGCETSSDAINDYPSKQVPEGISFLVTAVPVEVIEFPSGCTVTAAGRTYPLDVAERIRFQTGAPNPLNLPDAEIVVAYDYFRALQVEQAVSFSGRALTRFAPARIARAVSEAPVTWADLQFSAACGPDPVDVIPAYESGGLLEARIFIDEETACFSDDLRDGRPDSFTGPDYCITREEFDDQIQ